MDRGQRSLRQRTAFTLVELLIVITIIGILVGLTLPAISGARETARRVNCSNNVKNLANAAIQHETAVGYFPTGGWGGNSIGTPDPGSDSGNWNGHKQGQPGGFFYNILPFLEMSVVHDMPRDDSQVKMIQKVIPVMNCSTRRRAANNPSTASVQGVSSWFRADFSANAGSCVTSWGSGTVLSTSDWIKCDGVCYQDSQVRSDEIVDGLSNTYLVGEKYLPTDCCTNGTSSRDMYPALAGGDDLVSWTKADGTCTPQQDRPSDSSVLTGFGSAHATGFNIACCDGSVRFLNFVIDLETHRRLGCRNDRMPVDISKLGGL